MEHFRNVPRGGKILRLTRALNFAKTNRSKACFAPAWLGWLESNQHGQSQSLLSYH